MWLARGVFARLFTRISEIVTPTITLTDEQREVFRAVIDEGRSIFVTGRAGTGKSTLLTALVAALPGGTAVCAPTGVAALNVGGQTIHSLFRLRPGIQDHSKLARYLSQDTRDTLRGIDTLIIDEVSMVNADVMDAIDKCMRIAKRRARTPFGGAQVVMFGDPYQLAPVGPRTPEERAYYAEKYKSLWFFDADVWEAYDLEVVELTHIHRQRDGGFKQLLNAIRDGSVPGHWMVSLNDRYCREAPEDGEPVITLAATNQAVDAKNTRKLAGLPGSIRTYRAEVDGEFTPSMFPAEAEMRLKTDAQVMFLRNDPDGRWVNGTIGTVSRLGLTSVHVIVGDQEFEVEPVVWERYVYTFDHALGSVDAEQVGEFVQLPLRLAWAVTIHKSQGQTYDRAIIDLGSRAFSAGQVYVALSRLTSLDGLYLTRPIRPSDIIVDERVREFMTTSRFRRDDQLAIVPAAPAREQSEGAAPDDGTAGVAETSENAGRSEDAQEETSV